LDTDHAYGKTKLRISSFSDMSAVDDQSIFTCSRHSCTDFSKNTDSGFHLVVVNSALFEIKWRASSHRRQTAGGLCIIKRLRFW